MSLTPRILLLLTFLLFQHLTSSAYVDIETVLQQEKGFSITGVPLLGYKVDGIGDFNGDGYDDVIVATASRKDLDDTAFVVYGSNNPSSEIDIKNLDPSRGFAIRQTEPNNDLGYFVTGIGDINGDGLADILVGAGRSYNWTGSAYVIFGSRTPLSMISPQEGLDTSQGFAILGASASTGMGSSGASAGDINGDGIDDFMVMTDLYGYDVPSKVYVIFGSKKSFSTMIPAREFKPSQGFIISGNQESNEKVGEFLAKAGDINGDGIDDIVLGGLTNTRYGAGAAYVIYGSREPFQNMTPSLGLTRSQGFAIFGNSSEEALGYSVSAAGDVNGDGIDDLIIGAMGVKHKGAAYVIYGNKNGLSTITPSVSLDLSQGFAMYGDLDYSNLGQSVSGIGDINQDGIDDIIVVAGGMHGGSGEAYLVYGKKNHSSFVISATTGLDSSQGIVFTGKQSPRKKRFFVWTSANAGDVNGDGIDDIILGCTNAYKAHIIYGWKKCGPDSSCLRESENQKDNKDENPQNIDPSSEKDSAVLTWFWGILIFAVLFVVLYRPVRQFLVQRYPNQFGQPLSQARDTSPTELNVYTSLK